ncbi:MAG TPA: adenylate/guanylate cyclase domain-containing protein [Burkholderiales bacterium]|nr:adenylate/guanylate cyclase domain-containing protein [Burkholderiales bacterium]
MVHEAVLALDLVNSTELANHFGDRLAMRARNFLEEASAAAGRSQGLTFIESTGDGSMMTFPSVFAATQAALSVVQRLRTLPAELASGPPLQVRAAVAYGVILLDAHGQRHGATINKAFRMMSVTPDAFVTVGRAALEPHPGSRPGVPRRGLRERAARAGCGAPGRRLPPEGLRWISSRVRAARQ